VDQSTLARRAPVICKHKKGAGLDSCEAGLSILDLPIFQSAASSRDFTFW
jgi:hypothetical protein